MSTNSILNTEKFISNKNKNKPVDNNKKLTGLLSREKNDTMSDKEDPLAVQLKLQVRQMFNQGKG